MKKIFLLLLLIPIVLAIDYPIETSTITLDVGETKIVNGHAVNLIAISETGAIYLAIDDEQDLITEYGPEQYLKGVKIKLKSTEYHEFTGGSATLELTMEVPDLCYSDAECNDNNICTQESCKGTPRKCIYTGIGCEINGTCVQIGTISEETYCNEKNNWQNLKEKGVSCTQNYECQSDYCRSNKCSGFLLGSKDNIFQKIFGGGKMNWLILALAIILIGKGIFILLFPGKFKRRVSRLPKQTYRLSGILAIILGIILALIYYYL